MSESRALNLKVVLAAIDKASGPLKAITRGSNDAAKQVKKTYDELKKLKDQQAAVAEYRVQQAALKETADKLKAMRGRIKELQEAKHEDEAATRANAKELRAAQNAISGVARAYEGQLKAINTTKERLTKLGVDKAAREEGVLASKIDATNKQLDKQKAKLDALRGAEQALSRSRKNAAALAGKGGSVLANGVGIGAPLGLAANAYATEEDATTRLRNSMMLADRSVAPEFKAINDQAKEFGSRLPGTTAEFINMMSKLKSQGASAQAILGGLGESSAYLGVALKKPYEDAAVFASKYQDAVQGASAEMVLLMDQIQRANNMGVDDNNLLQGTTKVAPAMDILRKKGLAFSKEITPLLVMMDQSGMAGEAAGNALRKVFQASVDSKRRSKANDELRGTGINLDMSDGKGEFGGMSKMFAEIDKLKQLTSERRGAVIKAMYGDDAETLQVVNTLMNKGAAGYASVVASMEQQASLRDRVNELLNTLGNKTEAASGSWNAVMVEAGETLAPLLKGIVDLAAEAASGLLTWMQAHPGLTKAILYTAAVVAGLLAVSGTLMLVFAAFMGPLAILRFGLGMLGIKLGTTGMLARVFAGSWSWALNAVTKSWTFMRGVGGAVFSYLGGVLRWFGSAGWAALKMIIRGIFLVGKALLTNPIALAVMAIAALAYVIYDNWEPISEFFSELWDGIKAVFNSTIDWISDKFNAWFDKIKQSIQWLMEAMGVDGEMSVSGAVDTRPPLSAAAVNGRPVTVNMGAPAITVNAAPGMDAKAVGMEVQNQLLRMDRAAMARARGSLRDSY